MSEQDASAESIERRSVLKGLGVGAVSLLSATGISAGHDQSDRRKILERSLEDKRVAEGFTDDAAVEQALLENTADVRERLAEKGISIGESREDFVEVRVFPDRDDGTATAHIVAKREGASQTVEIHVLPQAGRAFAYEKTDTQLRRFDANRDKAS